MDVRKILEAEDGEAALVALKRARTFALEGSVIPLMDLLTPETSQAYEVTDPRTGKKKLNKR